MGGFVFANLFFILTIYTFTRTRSDVIRTSAAIVATRSIAITPPSDLGTTSDLRIVASAIPPGGAGMCLVRSGALSFSGTMGPSTRVLGNSMYFQRSDSCVCYSDTCFFRRAGSLRTFDGIQVRRKSALFICKSCLFCSKGARITCLHRGIQVRGKRIALFASDLGCRHVPGVKCCFRNKLVMSSLGRLSSFCKRCSPRAGLTIFGSDIRIRGPSFALCSSALRCSARSGMTAVLKPSIVISSDNAVRASEK